MERAGAEGTLRLSDLIARTGVPASTIHHYRRAGLLPPPQQAGEDRRFAYDDRHVEALTHIRRLREDRGLSLGEIGKVLPDLLQRADPGLVAPGDDPCLPADARQRTVDAAIGHFSARNYAEVTMAEVAATAGVAKGSVYRHFASKEELFLAVVEVLLAGTAADFAEAVRQAGGPEGIAGDRDAAAAAFAGVVARAMPILLELGARAAKGHAPSQDLARRVLVTLAAAAGRPLVGADGGDAASEEARSAAAVPAGLALIEQAFAVVLRWSVGDSWPDLVPLGLPRPSRARPEVAPVTARTIEGA